MKSTESSAPQAGTTAPAKLTERDMDTMAEMLGVRAASPPVAGSEVCMHCGKPLTGHGRSARCEDGATQFTVAGTPSHEIMLAEYQEIADAAAALMAGITWTTLQGKVMNAKLDASHADDLPRLAAALDGWRPKS